MAGRDPDSDDRDDGAPPAQRARPDDDPPAPVSVCGLEVGLLDVGRVVALNGYPEACRRLAFVSSGFYLERDLLMATKRVRYGPLKRTRLMSLSRKGDVERVSFLLKVGAEVDAADAGGWAVGSTSLHWAGKEGHASVVRLLLDQGADVGARTIDGKTPLHWACQWGQESVVTLLLDGGADMGAGTGNGWTPLHWASAEGRDSVILLLLDRGADVGVAGRLDWTPLHVASNYGRESVVHLLLDRGADITARTANGSTPLRLASQKGHASVVALLREAVARLLREALAV
jgi:ankyrin repeat protein